jgi:hypothetical protein
MDGQFFEDFCCFADVLLVPGLWITVAHYQPPSFQIKTFAASPAIVPSYSKVVVTKQNVRIFMVLNIKKDLKILKKDKRI